MRKDPIATTPRGGRAEMSPGENSPLSVQESCGSADSDLISYCSMLNCTQPIPLVEFC